MRSLTALLKKAIPIMDNMSPSKYKVLIFLPIIISQICIYVFLVWMLLVDKSINGEFQSFAWIVLISCFLLFTVCDVYLIHALNGIRAKFQDQTRLKLIEKAAIDEREHLSITESLNEKEREFHSEVKKTLIAAQNHYLNKNADAAEACLNGLAKGISTFKSGEYCENPIVNTILSSKSAEADALGIITDFNVNTESFPCDNTELCSLLTNILDNATEACRRVPRDSHPHIALTISTYAGLFLLSCRNSAIEGIHINNNKIFTQKKDGENHGWGLTILNLIAKKYQGEINTDFSDGIFCIRMTLQFEELDK